MAKRQYNNDFPSVTQVLDVLRKPGLEMWFKNNTPEYIKSHSTKAKNIGTATHEAIESYINTSVLAVDTEYPDEVTMALRSFVKFRSEHPEIKLRTAEIAATSLQYKYNGTIDLLGETDTLVIGDWKSGEAKEEPAPKIWDEYKYQVAAYVNLYNEITNANINRAFIVNLAKDKEAYNLYWMDADEINKCFNEVFLPALKITNYKRGK